MSLRATTTTCDATRIALEMKALMTWLQKSGLADAGWRHMGKARLSCTEKMRYSFDFSIHPLEAEVPIAGGQEGLPGAELEFSPCEFGRCHWIGRIRRRERACWPQSHRCLSELCLSDSWDTRRAARPNHRPDGAPRRMRLYEPVPHRRVQRLASSFPQQCRSIETRRSALAHSSALWLKHCATSSISAATMYRLDGSRSPPRLMGGTRPGDSDPPSVTSYRTQRAGAQVTLLAPQRVPRRSSAPRRSSMTIQTM
ncbi:hypothetical protein C8Q76DRAFT_436850 [Earliella scabrosa]|nr:hypothetical protein C8Q76DRAFT_436850 [Earliella scabrosa]